MSSIVLNAQLLLQPIPQTSAGAISLAVSDLRDPTGVLEQSRTIALNCFERPAAFPIHTQTLAGAISLAVSDLRDPTGVLEQLRTIVLLWLKIVGLDVW